VEAIMLDDIYTAERRARLRRLQWAQTWATSALWLALGAGLGLITLLAAGL
jgi:uncharacterized membrane protein YhiD involved in acid resistance